MVSFVKICLLRLFHIQYYTGLLCYICERTEEKNAYLPHAIITVVIQSVNY